MIKVIFGFNVILIFLVLMSIDINPVSVNHFKMDSAAVEALDQINPTSMHENFEYVGLIITTSSRTFATLPVTQRKKHNAITPKWYNSIYTGYVLAVYHTHAAMSNRYDDTVYNDCHFSKQDTLRVRSYQYLATPCNTILKFNYHDRRVYQYNRSEKVWMIAED